MDQPLTPRYIPHSIPQLYTVLSRGLFCSPMDCNPPGSSVHGISQAQEYWSGLPFPPPGDFPDPGIQPSSLSPALSEGFFAAEPPGKPVLGQLLTIESGHFSGREQGRASRRECPKREMLPRLPTPTLSHTPPEASALLS